MFTLLLEKSLTHAERGDGLSHLHVVGRVVCIPTSLQMTPNWGELEGRATMQRELNKTVKNLM